MKVRIHDTGPDGRPVACTGDTFAGRTFLEVVEGMMLNPFTQDANPVAYMRRILAGIGAGEGPLPDEPDEAAEAFLSRLVAAGYAAFAPEGSGDEKEKTDVNQPPKPEPPPPSERERLRARLAEVVAEVERATLAMVRLWVRISDLKKEG
jgi:hypothetical protein